MNAYFNTGNGSMALYEYAYLVSSRDGIRIVRFLNPASAAKLSYNVPYNTFHLLH